MLICAGMIIFIWFTVKRQKNIISRSTFLVSLGIDIILGMVVLVVLLSQKGYTSCICRSQELGGTTQSNNNDTFLVPPPLSLLCHWVEQRITKGNNGDSETTRLLEPDPEDHQQHSSKEQRCTFCWTIFTNTTSLVTFIASLSYLTQALPGIAISYYINPTASLIKLGFFELAVGILVVEIAFAIYLIDKCVWLAYVHCAEEIPDEVYEDEEISDKDRTPPGDPTPSRDGKETELYGELLKQITEFLSLKTQLELMEKQRSESHDQETESHDLGVESHDLKTEPHGSITNDATNAPPTTPLPESNLDSGSDASNTHPVDAEIVVISSPDSSHLSTSSKDDSSTPQPRSKNTSESDDDIVNAPPDLATVEAKPDPQNKATNLPTKTPQQPKKKKTIKYIEEYLVDGTKPKLISFGHWKCSYRLCHWLFFTSAFQIIVAMLLIGMSAPLLYFIMNIIIDQTSASNDQFKDILAIVPTIVLNTWLLIRYGNISHAIKDILGKATKSAMEHHDSHHGDHHHPRHHHA